MMSTEKLRLGRWHEAETKPPTPKVETDFDPRKRNKKKPRMSRQGTKASIVEVSLNTPSCIILCVIAVTYTNVP